MAFATLHLLQDDAVQEHGQLRSADFDAARPLASGSREAKDSLFEPFIPQAPSVLFPGQDFEPITLAVAEDEPVAGKRIVAQCLADEMPRPSNDLRRSAAWCRGRCVQYQTDSA